MVCIHCQHKTEVTNSRLQKRSNQVWRRRHCPNCQALFTTNEIIRYSDTWRVREQSGRLQPFSRDHLFLSILKSCEHRTGAIQDAASITETIIDKIRTTATGDAAIKASQIAHIAQVALNRFDKAASVHYQAFHGRH